MSKITRVLTGITTSGTPHLGNYAGAIRPAIQQSRQANTQSFFFLADYHSLIKVQDPVRVQRSTLEIAASWLACGLDPDRVWFYRQSDIPEIPELTWLLTCVAAKGLLNRAHAYKAAVDINSAQGQDPDAGINAGLYMYPVLMAADILLFGAHKVPVGKDQVQHIEMARDFGQRFNHLYRELLVLPEAVIEEQVSVLPGLDGRKMSKSYDNTIPLFANAAQLKKLIAAIVTDSRAPGEPKDPDNSHLFELYRAFASAEQTQEMAEKYRSGISWSDAKTELAAVIDSEISPMRARYETLMQRPGDIEDILHEGVRKARLIATPLLQQMREAVGLRALDAATPEVRRAKAKTALAQIKQYRDDDGRFYFKITDAAQNVLLQSVAFDSPKLAGELIKQLRSADAAVAVDNQSLLLAGKTIGSIPSATGSEALLASLDQLRNTD